MKPLFLRGKLWTCDLEILCNHETCLMDDILPQNQSPRGKSLSLGLCFFYPTFSNGITLAPVLLRAVGRLRDVGRCYRFHEAADFLRRAPLHIVGDVRIGVQCEPCAEVAQHTGQGFHIHAAGDCHRCECVSEVMEAHHAPRCPRFSAASG